MAWTGSAGQVRMGRALALHPKALKLELRCCTRQRCLCSSCQGPVGAGSGACVASILSPDMWSNAEYTETGPQSQASCRCGSEGSQRSQEPPLHAHTDLQVVLLLQSSLQFLEVRCNSARGAGHTQLLPGWDERGWAVCASDIGARPKTQACCTGLAAGASCSECCWSFLLRDAAGGVQGVSGPWWASSLQQGPPVL